MKQKKAVREDLRQIVVDTGRKMVETGMTVGTWGNISLRDPESNWMYISPSGMDYADIETHHVVVLDLDLKVIDGSRNPSVEKNMHAEVYRTRPDVHAVIHTHPVWSSILGVNRKNLPAVSEDFVQIAGAEVRCCETYELPGTVELGKAAVAALGQNNAVLLPSHGALSVGPDMKFALKVSAVLEKNAQIYVFATLTGTPQLFSDKDIRIMQEFARGYYGGG